MASNLAPLHIEILRHLESSGFVVFYGFPRGIDAHSAVLWDTDNYPDYRMFVAAAQAAGARLVSVHAREFEASVLTDVNQSLATAGIPREERRSIEVRLRKMKAYSGFICQIELSFDIGLQPYIFDLRTEWFDELNDILDQIDDADEKLIDEEGSLGGYFSKN